MTVTPVMKLVVTSSDVTKCDFVLSFSVPAINAFPKPEVGLSCVPNELFDVCGENMQCEKIGDTFLCRCQSGFVSKENHCEGKTMWNFMVYGYHQRENTGSRLFTEVKPCWTGLISGWVTISIKYWHSGHQSRLSPLLQMQGCLEKSLK